MSNGETNLDTLLVSMQPELQDGEYVFCHLPNTYEYDQSLEPILTFREQQGLALILKKEFADAADLPYDYIAAMITLKIHSSLDAVGFLAAITAKLAAAGISVNPVSAHFHDHLFVPVDKAELTMQTLAEFSI